MHLQSGRFDIGRKCRGFLPFRPKVRATLCQRAERERCRCRADWPALWEPGSPFQGFAGLLRFGVMMPEIRFARPLLVSIAAISLAACGGSGASTKPAESAEAEADAPAERAVADMYPKTRSTVKGTLVVRDSPEGLSIKGKLKGLDSGSFAITLHESGDCSSHDAKTVGPVWNPTAADPPVGFLGNTTGSDDS